MDAVHDEARARDVEHVWLEVIVENTRRGRPLRAPRLRARPRRRGLVAAGRRRAGPTTSDRSEAQAWIREHRTEREPWQRDDASLENGRGRAWGWRVDGAAAIVRVAGGRVSVLQLAGELSH